MEPFRTIVGILKEAFPNTYKQYKVQICLSLLLVVVALWGFNSNQYLHWRHFDESKFKIACSDFPPITLDDSNFYFKYLAFLSSAYPEGTKITDVRMEFQTRLSVNNSEILFTDIPRNLIGTEIKDGSVLLVQTDVIEGGQALGISIDCSRKKEGYLVASEGATVNLSYKILGKRHSKSLYLNPALGDFGGPKKEEIVFDILRVLDHRRWPEFPFSYEYAKLYSPLGDRTVRIYCSDPKNRFLRVKSESPSGIVALESEKQIHKDFDPIRIQVTANNDIRIHSWLGRFRLVEAAERFRTGLKYVSKGDFRAGADAFQKVTELDVKDYQAWFNLGLALEHEKDYQPAIVALRKAIEVRGDYFKAHGELASVLIRTGDNSGAAYHLDKAIRLNPKYAFAYYTLACLQKCEGKNDEAIRNLNLAIKYETDAGLRDKYLRTKMQFLRN
jgi:tetratricopeptide (TPR) repeat protein